MLQALLCQLLVEIDLVPNVRYLLKKAQTSYFISLLPGTYSFIRIEDTLHHYKVLQRETDSIIRLHIVYHHSLHLSSN